MSFSLPEAWRVKTGPMGSDSTVGNNGAFVCESPFHAGWQLVIIACDGIEPNAGNWEHVSVHAARSLKQMRTPSWAEMCFVKSIFWSSTDCVVQFHPSTTSYVNVHQHTLHLWRHRTLEFPTPPKECV